MTSFVVAKSRSFAALRMTKRYMKQVFAALRVTSFVVEKSRSFAALRMTSFVVAKSGSFAVLRMTSFVVAKSRSFAALRMTRCYMVFEGGGAACTFWTCQPLSVFRRVAVAT